MCRKLYILKRSPKSGFTLTLRPVCQYAAVFDMAGCSSDVGAHMIAGGRLTIEMRAPFSKISYTVKPTTLVSKAIANWLEKNQGISAKFVFDGETIPQGATFSSLGMNDGDHIVVLVDRPVGC